MARIYGSKWMQFGESDDGTWLDGLTGITPEQVAHGLSELVADCYEWPPSLPEFKRLCLDVDEIELNEFIEQKAFAGFDSYWLRMQEQKTIDKLVNDAKKSATKEYMRIFIQNNSDNALRLTNG